MRVLCQYIAVRANREDNELGKFWQSRFRAVRLLDEATLLACAAYVDLNPIRAAMAETLEHSHYTSVQRRIQSFSPANDNSTSATSATSQPKKEISDNPVGVVISCWSRDIGSDWQRRGFGAGVADCHAVPSHRRSVFVTDCVDPSG